MAGNDDTVQEAFYAPWPNFGKALNQQWGEIRHDIAVLAPLVRGAGLDASGDFSSLDSKENTALQAWELGEDGFHNKTRIHWNKDDDQFEIQANVLPGTSAVPNWYTVWAVGDQGQVVAQTSATTASNVGSGSGVFKEKVGTDLRLRSVIGTGVMTVTQNTNDITITSSAEANTASSLGGVSLVGTKTGVDLPFRGLTAGSSTTLTNLGTSIRIDSTAQVVEFYGIGVQYHDGSKVYPSVHNIKLNRNDFYITQKKTNPSSHEITINARGDSFSAANYVEVAGDTMTGALLHPNGTVGAPAISFSAETDTGITRLAADDLALITGGTAQLRALSDRVYFPTNIQVNADGTAAAPDIFFFPDTDSGIYQVRDNTVGFTTGGVRAGWFSPNQDFYVTGKVYAAAGSANRPAYSFGGELDMGMFKSNTLTLAFAIQGAVTFATSTSQTYSTVPVRLADAAFGTNSAPAYSWDTDNNTGMYRSGADELSFSTGSTQAGYFDNAQDFRLINDLYADAIYASEHIDVQATGPYFRLTDTGDSNHNWSFTTASGTKDLTIAPSAVAAASTLTLDATTIIYPSMADIASGNNVTPFTFSPTISVTSGGANSSTFIQHASAVSCANTSAYTHLWMQVAPTITSTATSVAGNMVGLSVGAVSLSSTAAAMPIVNRDIRVGSEMRANNVAAGTHSHATVYPGSITMNPLFNSVGASGSMTITLARGLESRVRLTTNNAAGSVVVTTFDDFVPIATTKAGGGGTETLTTRNFLNLPDDSGPVNLNGILCAMTSGAAKKFINHTGTAASLHTGDFVVTDEAYASSWNGNNAVPTKNALYDKIETISVVANAGTFYGVIFKETEVGGAVMRDDQINFDSAHFYLSGGGGRKPILSLQRDQMFEDINANKTLTVGTIAGATGDSSVDYYDNGTLQYSAGWDTSAEAYVLADGVMGTGQDQMRFKPAVIEVTENMEVFAKVSAQDVVAGSGNFYTTLRGGKVYAGSFGTQSLPSITWWQAPTTGMFLSSASDMRFALAGVGHLAIQSNGVIPLARLKVNLAGGAPTTPSYTWNSDQDTGLYQVTAGENMINFCTGGVRAGFFDSYQHFYVTNNVSAKRFIAYSRQAYTVSNLTVDRSYDADTVLVAELADVVGTLITDLVTIGLIKR